MVELVSLLVQPHSVWVVGQRVRMILMKKKKRLKKLVAEQCNNKFFNLKNIKNTHKPSETYQPPPQEEYHQRAFVEEERHEEPIRGKRRI